MRWKRNQNMTFYIQWWMWLIMSIAKLIFVIEIIISTNISCLYIIIKHIFLKSKRLELITTLTEMFYMVGLIRPPKNHRSWIPSCGSSVRHIWKAWSRFFGFRAKKRAETAKTADFGPKSSFLAQKWLDVLNPFWSSEMHQIWSICMILPKKLAYEAKLDIFGLFIY